MPTYEYVCRNCGHLFEIVQSMTDDPPTECPECGGELRKVFAPPAISFKGSGFYTTDHSKKKEPTEKKSDGKPNGTGGEKKSEPGGGEKKAEPAGSTDGGAASGPKPKEGAS